MNSPAFAAVYEPFDPKERIPVPERHSTYGSLSRVAYARTWGSVGRRESKMRQSARWRQLVRGAPYTIQPAVLSAAGVPRMCTGWRLSIAATSAGLS